MKTTLLSLGLLAVAVIGPSPLLAAPAAAPAAAPVPAAARANAPDPAVEIKHLAQLFRAGDLAGLAQGLTPRRQWEQARLAYEMQRNKPTSEAERARFAEKLQQFTAPDAVDQMMAKLEPEMARARPQAAGMLLMGMGALSVAVNSSDTQLTDAQREALRSALPGIQRWVNSTDFFSTASLRHALTVLTDAARRTGITDIDQLKALPLEGVLEQASPMLAAAKEAVRTYGVDLDAIADSLRVDVLERGADTARVRTTITVFGAPVWAEHDLVLIDGHWYGKGVHVDLDEVAGL
ncbi:MAG: hypothetical protein BGP24_09180 [Lysobacterales bacterium 69-70]|nr:hypothetical protein [Xanthomonadaceae bacterium]ODU33135.1 MAG: hypothetical protein ABS97_12205 [Xanthomonadaceae bacterium SCN 69-320]ODV20537.1 MAG: hypothetical protein ABT27_07470 [Xanthomonadaceae bacterium SCN 69-25]OJZ00681.1 MAG: hypothetical protein BGP24_09180 [Xanthomonadales bacterium 69-70]